MKISLNDVIVKTFEQIAFWEPEVRDSFDPNELPLDPKVCKISCLNPIRIDLVIIMGHNTAQQLSDDINQNLFGAGEESIDDCVKEVMNVLGGEFCIQEFPVDEFELTIPEIVSEPYTYNLNEMTKYECDEGDFYFQAVTF